VNTEDVHLQFMVITNHKRLLVHSQKENTFTAVGYTNTFCGHNHMNTFTVLYSHSLLTKRDLKISFSTDDEASATLILITETD
jgi:hypothetical protein